MAPNSSQSFITSNGAQSDRTKTGSKHLLTTHLQFSKLLVPNLWVVVGHQRCGSLQLR
jgi:hypothetical protein